MTTESETGPSSALSVPPGSPPLWPCPHGCLGWARISNPREPQTNHHPRCEHVDASLIDVWKLTIDGSSCYFDDAPLTEEMGLEPGSFTVEKLRMHAEVFRQLPEFTGW